MILPALPLAINSLIISALSSGIFKFTLLAVSRKVCLKQSGITIYAHLKPAESDFDRLCR